ncbi:MAG TPA: ATP-binding cassette domain-containing protein [Blastocatellia bacterium]|nr:ATP-binding cassette domain-containing protein [Blastocatellia bacterium]
MTTQSAPDAPAIEFRNVSLSFEDRRALQGVSFTLGREQMIIITGASGSGKSVLLHLAIGLLRPDEGEILIEGREIQQLDEKELLSIRSRRMGLVFQEDTLFTGLDTYENTAYRLVEHGWPEVEIERAVPEILAFVGLEKDVDKLPEELSIGMRRRLELARALAGWPPIMLFDEPTIGLDPINARQVLDLIIRARDIHRISSLLVTKELHQIPYVVNHEAASDASGAVTIRKAERTRGPKARVMTLDEGEIAFLGTPEEFDASGLPSVIHLTHPEIGMHKATGPTPNPWKEREPTGGASK